MAKIKKICKFCKSIFYVHPYRKDDAKYCSRKCGSSDKTGSKHNAWKNGKNLMTHGYIRIRINKKYVYEHRYIMEKYLERPLKRNEIIHHIDGDKTNNNINNLKLMTKNKHDAMEANKRWEDSPHSFNGKERCLQPRIDRHAKGRLCMRFKPCPFHNLG